MTLTRTYLLAFALVAGTAGALAAEEKKMLFAFDTPDAAKEWMAVNDGVMGGVSDGRFKVTDAKTMEFFGTCRARVPWDAAGADGTTRRQPQPNKAFPQGCWYNDWRLDAGLLR